MKARYQLFPFICAKKRIQPRSKRARAIGEKRDHPGDRGNKLKKQLKISDTWRCITYCNKKKMYIIYIHVRACFVMTISLSEVTFLIIGSRGYVTKNLFKLKEYSALLMAATRNISLLPGSGGTHVNFNGFRRTGLISGF